MSKKPFFTGPFAPICESYVAQKRASGLDYNQQAKLLRLFVKIMRFRVTQLRKRLH